MYQFGTDWLLAGIATKLKPFEPKYFRALADLYEKAGLQHRAQRTLDQLKAIDPTYGMVDTADAVTS